MEIEANLIELKNAVALVAPAAFKGAATDWLHETAVEEDPPDAFLESDYEDRISGYPYDYD